ncbi:MAG: type II toxin-antitoxin system ParD family antitoxin [Fimbriimonadaceae bacterium]|nr:type II toxin-antitoxin system ParD family antitoxin [Fimbriimonadaceae bacterium]
MHVSLTPELDEYVLQKVKTGRYNSASEVVREALRLHQENDEVKRIRLDKLRNEIQRGVDDLDAGRFVEASAEELAELISQRGRKRLNAADNKRNAG